MVETASGGANPSTQVVYRPGPVAWSFMAILCVGFVVQVFFLVQDWKAGHLAPRAPLLRAYSEGLMALFVGLGGIASWGLQLAKPRLGRWWWLLPGWLGLVSAFQMFSMVAHLAEGLGG